MVENNKFIESTKKYIEDRLASPFWITYLVSWFLWNWEVWYVTFFVDSTVLSGDGNLTKVDYIKNIYQWGWGSLSAIYWDLKNICYLFVLPILSSYLIIFQFPRLTILFYKKALGNDFNEMRIKEEEERSFLKAKKQKLDIKEKVLTKEKKIEDAKIQKPQEQKWDDEYAQFKASKYYLNFNEVRDVIYQNNGYNSSMKGNMLTSEAKSFFDVSGIIEIYLDNKNSERIKLTEKGKYFMKKYLEEN